MPSQDNKTQNESCNSAEDLLFEAISRKNLDQVKKVIREHSKINLNCVDKDELSPLQHACHMGDVELAKLLLDNGANVNFAQRKDAYTPLMFAAISSRADIVKLLLERGVDTTAENCVNRTAAQMAAFVGQTKIVSIINSWSSYESTVEPYTRCRELESEPRLPTKEHGKLLHNYIVYPSLHPVKLLLFIKSNLDLIIYANRFKYVLENLSSKVLKPPNNEESLSLKYYYLAYLIEYCEKSLKTKSSLDKFDEKMADKCLETIIRKLVKREQPDDIRMCTPQLDHFILECLLKYPYTQLTIFKTMTFALTKRETGDSNALAILTQTLNGPRMFNQPEEACAICGEVDKNKKCSKCKSIYYCGSICQKADWFQHKKVCKSPEETPLLRSDNQPNDEEHVAK